MWFDNHMPLAVFDTGLDLDRFAGLVAGLVAEHQTVGAARTVVDSEAGVELELGVGSQVVAELEAGADSQVAETGKRLVLAAAGTQVAAGSRPVEAGKRLVQAAAHRQLALVARSELAD